MRKQTFLLFLLLLVTFLTGNLFSQNTSYSLNPDELVTKYLWQEITRLSPQNRPRVVLVLSGGGARGLAHIGVLKVLDEENIPIDAIVGTSVGALIGALYCSDIDINKIESMSQDIGWSQLTNFSPPSIVGLLLTEKLLSTENMEKYIARNIRNKQFHELKIPFACVATDLRTGEKIIFREGDVAHAARASSTIPGVFNPVEYRHRQLVDGGIVDNIPVDVAKMFEADIIIAVDISADFSQNSTSNIMLVLNQAIYIQGDLLSREALKGANIVINPKVGDVSAYELWRAKECIDAGIMATRKKIPDIKKMVMDITLKRYLAKKQ